MKDPRKEDIQSCHEHKNPNEAATLSIRCRLRQPKITGRISVDKEHTSTISALADVKKSSVCRASEQQTKTGFVCSHELLKNQERARPVELATCYPEPIQSVLPAPQNANTKKQ